jgi:hypothetical protein
MVALGMTYSGTKGVPEKKGDDYVLVQSMRLPRDVIMGNSGLCVELTQLWCSIAINAGAGCYIVQIPGHSFPVLRAGDGSLLAIEATAIGGAFEGGNLGRANTFEEAVTSGTETFAKVQRGELPSIFVDVLAYRDEGIRPPELPDVDRTTVVKQLDERLAAHRQGNDPRRRATGGRSWQDPQGRVALKIPAGWVVQDNVVEQMKKALPGYALSALNPATKCGAEVIFFDGATNPDETAQVLAGVLGQLGVEVQMGKPERDKVSGHPAVDYDFEMRMGQLTVSVLVSVVQIRGGLVVFTLGGPAANVKAAMPEFQELVQTIQLAP